MSENKKSSPNKFVGRLLDNVLTGGQVYRGIASRRRDRLAAEAEFDARLKTYEDSTFQELDPDDYKQENVFEDIQVDTQAAEFASEQFRQQQANIMEVYRGTAGGSGVAALAQTLSNQAAKQAKDTSVNIAQQLAQNKKIKLGEESRLKQQERQLQLNEAMGKRQFEADKMATMIGVAGQKIAGVNLRTQNAIAIGGQVVEGITAIGKTIAGLPPVG
tara:strand:+ start:68 stop:718 length:651 start_codon:yes stop_codon:yes gene_type:complete